MTDEQFVAWAAEHGVPPKAVKQLTLCAATPEEIQAAYEAIEPPPPIYTLRGIKEMSEASSYSFCALQHGFILVGGCPNGDPIAIDITDDMGSVWYIDHTSMHDNPPRSVAVRVADDVERLVNGMAYEDNFPFDYYDAKQKQK